MKNLICVVCPKGCRLQVEEKNGYAVTGNDCPRGEEYGKKEVSNPTRVLTSTVRIKDAQYNRLPVKTNKDIPKKVVREAVALLNGLTEKAPIKAGDVVGPPIPGTSARFIATKSLPKYSHISQ